MVPISSALELLLKKTFSYNASLKNTQLIIASWKKIMGQFAEYTGVLSLDNDELKIWVSMPQILYELKLLQVFIISAIHREVPSIKINSIAYSIKKYKKFNNNKNTIQITKEKKIHSAETLNHVDYVIAQHVADEELKAILKKVYVSCVV